MFGILRKTLKTGVVTTGYPQTAPEISRMARGRPEINFEKCLDSRVAARACPTGAFAVADQGSRRKVNFDLGRCVFCGLCAEADPAIRMTNCCELAVSNRSELQLSATYSLKQDGNQGALLEKTESMQARQNTLESLGQELKGRIDRVLGRSLHIREVDAGSCNGCEIEVAGLNSPVYDLERFGMHFVASPRHADMILVTGPVSRNMELALRKTYDAMPSPRLVVAAGACACSGGIFGPNYATVGGVDKVVPVNVYVPGCPPNPHALLHGILLAIGRQAIRTVL